MVDAFPGVASELDSDFHENDRIFHYTSGESLAGILQSNCLWATHFLALNDRQEFMSARDAMASFSGLRMAERLAALKVNKRIKPLPGAPPIREVAQREGERFVDSLYKAMFMVHQPYVFSGFICNKQNAYAFENGVLQHWATYGGGSGFAIQINPHALATALRGNEERFAGDLWSTGKVDYSKGLEPPTSLREFYEQLGKKAQEVVEQVVFRPEDKIDIADVISAFIRIASYSKHHFFEIEQEARLVILRVVPEVEGVAPHEVFIRAGGKDVVSYVKVLESVLLSTPDLIERIVVGPGGDRARRSESIKEYVRMRHINIDVTTSEIPYLPH